MKKNNSIQHSDDEDSENILFKRIISAVFYGVASFMITIVNKTVLTTYKFPSFQVLGIGQMTMIILVLAIANKLKFVSFPHFQLGTFKQIFPLPLLYIGNMIFGLGGTKELSLPMFTALRRFSILMTMILEFYLLGVFPSISVQISVYTMILGALLATSDDLAFNLHGYVYIMLNDLLTATGGVYTKKKLDARELGKYGLMYYNSLFMIVPAIIIAYYSGDLESVSSFNDWDNPFFVAQFLISCIMGFILMYSVMLCTHYNSALTTTIIGCLKNISVTYLGMVIGGDYIFSWINFIGLNISVLGSLIYTYVTFRKKETKVSYNVLKNETRDNIV